MKLKNHVAALIAATLLALPAAGAWAQTPKHHHTATAQAKHHSAKRSAKAKAQKKHAGKAAKHKAAKHHKQHG